MLRRHEEVEDDGRNVLKLKLLNEQLQQRETSVCPS